MIAQALLELDAVAVGHGDVVHVHAEHQAADLLRIGDAGGHAGPHGDLLLRGLVLPVADDDLALGDAHPGADVAELDVAVGALVQVHEVHVDVAPRNLRVVLGVEVQEGLLQGLEALDPHLGGGEGVHPGDDADALLLVVRGLHHGLDLLAGVGGTLIDDLDGNVARRIQAFHHFLGMSVDGDHRISAVEELRTGHPP